MKIIYFYEFRIYIIGYIQNSRINTSMGQVKVWKLHLKENMSEGLDMSLKGIQIGLILCALLVSFVIVPANTEACFTIEVTYEEAKNVDKGDFTQYEIQIDLSPGCKSIYYLTFSSDEPPGTGWSTAILNESGGVLDYGTEVMYSGTVTVYFYLMVTAPIDASDNEPYAPPIYLRATDYYNQEDNYDIDTTTTANPGVHAPAPVSLWEVGNTTNSIDLGWDQSMEPSFGGYELHMSSINGFIPVETTILQTFFIRTQTAFTVDGLSEGTDYYFVIRIWDNEISTGPYFADSNQVKGRTQGINYPPIAVWLSDPTNIKAREVTLTWTQNTDLDFASYEIHSSLDPGFTPDTSTRDMTVDNQTITSVEVGGLEENCTLYFKVRVIDHGGLFNDSNEVSCHTEDWDPVALTLYDPTNTNSSSTHLSWSQSTDYDFQCYEIYISEEEVFTPSQDTYETSITDSCEISIILDLPNELTTYYFCVRLVDLANNYNDSNIVSTTTLDGTPPTIIANLPLHNAVDVDVTQDITITFSEEMDQGTVTFSCTPDCAGWSEIWSALGDEVVYQHSNDFDDSTLHTFEITAGTDLGGNALEGTTSFSFTTKDLTKPEITLTSPVKNAQNVLLDTTVSITFSEAMDQSSVEGAINAPFSYGTPSWNGNRITLTPSQDLDYSTEYTISVGTQASDLAGNQMALKYTLRFTTEADDTNHEPVVTVSSPNNNEVDESVIIAWSASDIDEDFISISIYYDTDTDDTSGLTLIKSSLSNSGSYEWDTSDIDNGDYYIYVVAYDGDLEAGAFSGKLTIAHPEEPDNNGGDNPDGIGPSKGDDSESFPMILLVIIICAILGAVIVAAYVLGSKKATVSGGPITCPSCGKQFMADTSSSPYVQCPFCGTAGMMK